MTIIQAWPRRRAATACVLLAAAAVGAAVYAQNPARDRSGLGSSMSYEEYVDGAPARLSELVDMRVRGTSGSTIGHVEDVVLGKPDNELALIVAVGGLREIGDKLIARPLQEFRIAADGSELYLDITNQQLSAEPPYAADASDEQAPSAVGPSAHNVVPGERVASLLGASVTDESGREIGRIDDVLVRVDGKGETQVVLAIGGIVGFGAKLVAVPIDSIEIARSDAQNGPVVRPRVRLEMHADAIEQLPPFEYSDRQQRTAAL